MAVAINIYYTGKNGKAKLFAEEMVESGVMAAIRAEAGNIRYDYFFPMNDENTVLLIDEWKDQEALDIHHASPMMQKIIDLRNKYDLSMRVERFVSDDAAVTENDKKFIK